MSTKRLAAMDIGTNSIRCIVVEANHKGGYKVLDDEMSTVRLGEDLSRTGAISLQADGLDRRSNSAVQSISCLLKDGSITINLCGSEDMSLEIFGVTAKKELFEKAFNVQAVFVV